MTKYYMPCNRPDPNDPLAIPAFLDRRTFIEEDGETMVVLDLNTDLLATIRGERRTWAPIRHVAREVEKPAIFCDAPMDPVHVMGGTPVKRLQEYANWAEFMRLHDFEDYPVKKVVAAGGVTYAQVRITVAATRESGMTAEMENIQIPAAGTLRAHIWEVAEKAWVAGGSPTDESRMKDIRKGVMAKFLREGVNRVTATTGLRLWAATKKG